MYKILWVDDEIDLLKPYTLYLKNKGYEGTVILIKAIYKPTLCVDIVI